MILPEQRDPRFILIRRGGTLTDEHHRLLAIWAAKCAEHVLHYFEREYPEDDRPKKAIELAKAWANQEITVTDSKVGAWEANNAARGKSGPAKYAALAAGQAAAVAHVAAHELGAAAYAIRAIIEANPNEVKNGINECIWQRNQLPESIKLLVIEDEENRNSICWNVFRIK